MECCVNEIEKLHQSLDVTKKIMLMSDSMRFLEFAASRLSYVTYVPGRVLHIDFCDATPDDVNMKLFLLRIFLGLAII